MGVGGGVRCWEYLSHSFIMITNGRILAVAFIKTDLFIIQIFFLFAFCVSERRVRPTSY